MKKTIKKTTEVTEKRISLCSQKKHKEKVYETTRFHEITTEKQMIYRLKGLNKEENLVKICVNLWLLS